jgi:LPXTG-motif cell wall-anchored protein
VKSTIPGTPTANPPKTGDNIVGLLTMIGLLLVSAITIILAIKRKKSKQFSKKEGV